VLPETKNPHEEGRNNQSLAHSTQSLVVHEQGRKGGENQERSAFLLIWPSELISHYHFPSSSSSKEENLLIADPKRHLTRRTLSFLPRSKQGKKEENLKRKQTMGLAICKSELEELVAAQQGKRLPR